MVINNFEFLIGLLLVILFGYLSLLIIENINYLKILILFELILLLLSLIFIIDINENIEHFILLIIILVGGESCLALTMIFPFIIK